MLLHLIAIIASLITSYICFSWAGGYYSRRRRYAEEMRHWVPDSYMPLTWIVTVAVFALSVIWLLVGVFWGYDFWWYYTHVGEFGL